MMRLSTIGFIVLIIAALLASSSLFTVNEGQQALLLRLGEIRLMPSGQAQVENPGLHFKTPFITQVKIFDTRLQTLTVQSSPILTQEQKYVLVDYYIKWRINNLPLYYKRTSGDIVQTQTLLQQQVNDVLRAAFGQHTITDVVSGERVNIMALLTKSANATANNLGINVIDVRIKTVDLPEDVSEKVFNRMRSKREQVATQYRAEGKAQAEAIQAMADAKAAVMVATAKKQAAQLKAQGVTQAATIYADAYNQDPDFYAFYQSLEAYKSVFNKKSDILILKPDSEFFKYFNNLPGPAKSK